MDCGVDCVGFEARGHGDNAADEHPATVLNSLMTVTRAGGALGIPGLYVTDDPGSKDENAKSGVLGIRIGLGWANLITSLRANVPVMKYNHKLMMAILHDRIQIAKAVNVTLITLDQSPQGYMDFDKGAARKFVIDPHGLSVSRLGRHNRGMRFSTCLPLASLFAAAAFGRPTGSAPFVLPFRHMSMFGNIPDPKLLRLSLPPTPTSLSHRANGAKAATRLVKGTIAASQKEAGKRTIIVESFRLLNGYGGDCRRTL